LIDGEHYPPVTRWAVEVAGERGFEVVAALLVGGTE
jgi:predicted GTPase